MDLDHAAQQLAAALDGEVVALDADPTAPIPAAGPPASGPWQLVAHAADGRCLIACSTQSRLIHRTHLAAYGLRDRKPKRT